MKTSGRLVLGVLLAGAYAAASAHTGHGAEGLLDGLAHPFGPDHLLAMLAVGMWSAVALPAGGRAIGPAVFMGGLLLGAVMAAAAQSWSLAGLPTEAGLAISVVVFGVMLAAPRAVPLPMGLALVGVAAVLHGLAHGAELPPSAGFAGYAAGFLATTAVLHGAGLGIGRAMARAHAVAWQAAGAALGVTGLVMLAQA